MARLILVRGLPGSGKSTIARGYAAIGFRHYEADQYFEQAGHYAYDATQVREAHAWCRAQVAAALAAGHDVVVANTFTRRWEVESYAEIGRAAGAVVEVVAARGVWPNIHGVPPEVVQAMRARWED